MLYLEKVMLFPAVENSLSDGADVTGTPRIDLANPASRGNFSSLAFHQLRTSSPEYVFLMWSMFWYIRISVFSGGSERSLIVSGLAFCCCQICFLSKAISELNPPLSFSAPSVASAGSSSVLILVSLPLLLLKSRG